MKLLTSLAGYNNQKPTCLHKIANKLWFNNIFYAWVYSELDTIYNFKSLSAALDTVYNEISLNAALDTVYNK